MRRVRFYGYGGPEVLSLEEAPAPSPDPGSLLVRVARAGVALPGVRATLGGVDLPCAPGGEVVGRVVGVGPGVTGWADGDRVAGLAFAGSYAELAVLPAAFAVPVPEGLSDDAAAMLVRAGQVALGALDAARLRAGESVLVTGAASSVGHLAVQLARIRDAARVVAAVSAGPASAAKAAALRDLGVDSVVHYEELATDPVDVVLDGVGGPVQALGVAGLAPFGRLVSFNGAGTAVDANLLRMRSTAVIGFNMAHFAKLRPELYAANLGVLEELCLGGRLRPLTHAVLPLEDAAEAHRIIESRSNVGRVFLAP